MTAGMREPGEDDEPSAPPSCHLPPGVTELEPWKQELTWASDKDGEPKLTACIGNVALMLTHDSAFKGCFAHNELARKTLLTQKLPHVIGVAPAKRGTVDVYVRDTTITALKKHCNLTAGKDVVKDGIEFAARQRRFNPLRDELDALKWDGKSRLDKWLTLYLGVALTEYTQAVGRWWLISMMARIYKPGCQADHVLVLEGPQGAAKSSALRIIFGADYFTDQLPDLSSKDAQQQLLGMSGVELGEMDALSRHDVTRIKAFLTVRMDRYRPPYEPYVVDIPRTCIFAGSTNKPGYLRDDTGNRRFWPVKVGTINLVTLAAERDQLLAEARLAFEGGAQWWPTRDNVALAAAIEDEQDQRYVGDEWEGKIAAWLEGAGGSLPSDPRDHVTVGDILTGLGVAAADWTPVFQQRVGAVMGRLGWTVGRAREHGVRVRRYSRPELPVADPPEPCPE